MAKLEEEREKLWREEIKPALKKSRVGESLTIREEILVAGWGEDRPLVKGPWIIRYYTSEEEEGRGFGELGGTLVPLKDISIRRLAPKFMSRTLVHEIGHSRHTECPYGVKEEFLGSEDLRIKLWEEMVALYFVLKFKPYNRHSMESIRLWREISLEKGLSEEEIDRVEGEAMEEVSYKGRRVK